jgi:hypothetical protein
MSYREVQTTDANACRGPGAMDHRSRTRDWALVDTLVLWGGRGWNVAIVPALPIEYFALGDSVASGYGLADDEMARRRSINGAGHAPTAVMARL